MRLRKDGMAEMIAPGLVMSTPVTFSPGEASSGRFGGGRRGAGAYAYVESEGREQFVSREET